jgi:hypothetical protein
MHGDQKEYRDEIQAGELYTRYESIHLYNFIKLPQNGLFLSTFMYVAKHRHVDQVHTKFIGRKRMATERGKWRI